MLTRDTVDYAELEALDISKLNDPQGIDKLATQVLSFINKNGIESKVSSAAADGILRLAGFFYVKGHGLSDEQIRRQYALGQAFFDLAEDEKLKYLANTAVGDFRGYKPISQGKLGARDNDERYNIPKFTAEHERPHPQLILDHLDEIKQFSLVSSLLK